MTGICMPNRIHGIGIFTYQFAIKIPTIHGWLNVPHRAEGP